MDENLELLELEPPHGFLITQGKQTAIARAEPLDIERSYLIVSNGEAYGTTGLEEPAQVKVKEFDNDEYFDLHRVMPRERRQWWPDTETFYVYRLKDFEPFETVKLYENGQVVDEPRLTSEQWQTVSRAKELPRTIIINEDFISLTTDHSILCKDKSFYNREVKPVMDATFNKQVNWLDAKDCKEEKEIIPIYSLALVRNPRMRVLKKNISPEAAEEIQETEIKQEDESMPYRIREREGEFCVIKVNPDDTDGETEGCHGTREEAQAQLTALNINVVAEEENSAKTIENEPNFLKRLELAAKNIIDIVTLAKREQRKTEVDILTSNYGIAQKEVNGELWHFTWSTNAFEDREKEIFSTQALENYVLQAETKQDRGYFNLWHINAEDGNFNTDFARKEWQGVVGRFLVEAGPYLDDEKGKAAKKFFNQFSEGHPQIAPEGWGCSPEFRYLPEERETGIYENIWITRTSTLPKMAAANIWTETRQLTRSKNMLTDDQMKSAIALFGKDYVDNLLNEGDKRTENLEAANVAHKEIKEEEQGEPTQVNINMEDLAAEVGKQFAANLDPIAEAISSMATELKELKQWKEAQEKDDKVKAVTESPRYMFNLTRASEDEKTVVTEDDKLQNQKPDEAKKNKNSDPFDQLFNM